MRSPTVCSKCNVVTRKLLAKTKAKHLPFFAEGKILTCKNELIGPEDDIMVLVCEKCENMRTANLSVEDFINKG